MERDKKVNKLGRDVKEMYIYRLSHLQLMFHIYIRLDSMHYDRYGFSS